MQLDPARPPALEPVSPPEPPDDDQATRSGDQVEPDLEPAYVDEVAVDLPHPIEMAVDRRAAGAARRRSKAKPRKGFTEETYLIDQVIVKAPTMDCLEEVLKASEALVVSLQAGVRTTSSSIEMSIVRACIYSERGDVLSRSELNQVRGLAVGRLFERLMDAFRRVGGQAMLEEFYESRMGEGSGGPSGGDA